MLLAPSLQTPPVIMNFGEKVKTLREHLNLSRPAFATAIGVSLDTIQRAERQNPERENQYILSGVVRVFPSVESFFTGQSQQLPDNLNRTLALEKSSTPSTADGQRLRIFLSRKGIAQKELAEKLGLSAAQVNHYLKSETLRSDIKRKIADALNFPESMIFPKPVLDSPIKLTDIIALPVVSAESRSKLTHQSLVSILENFEVGGSDAYYLHKRAVPSDAIENAFIVEVTRFDNMQPVLPASSLALAILLTPEQYENVNNDYVLISIGAGNIIIRKIASNNLRTSDALQLSTLDGYGGTLTVRRSDIDFMCILKKAIVDL